MNKESQVAKRKRRTYEETREEVVSKMENREFMVKVELAMDGSVVQKKKYKNLERIAKDYSIDPSSLGDLGSKELEGIIQQERLGDQFCFSIEEVEDE